MSRVNVIARDNGAGLSVDLALVVDALRSQHFEVTVTAIGHRSRLSARAAAWTAAVRRRFSTRPLRHDINLMLERVLPEHLGQARRNVLVPNPEWFDTRWSRWLPAFDAVLTKTRHALPLFDGLGCRTAYVGFASRDLRDVGVERERAFLHAPGRSNHKGTTALLRLWQQNPHWPRLTVLWRSREASVPEAGNIHWLRERVDDRELARLQNAHAFHLCPSETEGYGHYLAEALGVGAVAVTVDAPPMSELVTSERGVLCAARPFATQGLATLYRADDEALRAAIERCIGMGEAERLQIGTNARRWFEDNNRAFPVRLGAALNGRLS